MSVMQNKSPNINLTNTTLGYMFWSMFVKSRSPPSLVFIISILFHAKTRHFFLGNFSESAYQGPQSLNFFYDLFRSIEVRIFFL